MSIDRCVVIDGRREDGRERSEVSCLGRAAGLRSRGARRSSSGFDCEPWRKRDVDSAGSGLARCLVAPAARNHKQLAASLPARTRTSPSPNLFAHTLLLFPHPHHQHPSTSITTSHQPHPPLPNHIKKNCVSRPTSFEMAPKAAQVRISPRANTRFHATSSLRSPLTPTPEDSHHRRQGPGRQGSR